MVNTTHPPGVHAPSHDGANWPPGVKLTPAAGEFETLGRHGGGYHLPCPSRYALFGELGGERNFLSPLIGEAGPVPEGDRDVALELRPPVGEDLPEVPAVPRSDITAVLGRVRGVVRVLARKSEKARPSGRPA